MTQQIQTMPVEIPNVPMPLLSGVHLRGKNKYEIHSYSQNSPTTVFIDDSRYVNLTANGLRDARPSYSSLMNYGMNQKMLEQNKVTEGVLRETFAEFDKDIWQRCWVWAEFMDSQPEKRGYKLPEGKDVALYRGVKVSGETIDTSRVEPLFLTYPKKDGEITVEWMEALVDRGDTYHWVADLDYSKKHLDGLNALLWGFWLEGPVLGSYWGPQDRYSYWGALLGSKLSADETVKSFLQSPQPKVSQYQLQLRGLEEELEGSKKLYAELGNKITNIENGISNIKKIKPE